MDNFASKFGLGRSYEQQGRAAGQLGRPGATSNISPAADLAQREELDFDNLRSQGLSPQIAAAVVANMETEPGLQAHGKPGDGGLAYGKGQWHPERQEHFRQIFGHDIWQSTDAEQLMFRVMELKGTGGDSLSAKSYNLMNVPGMTAGQAGALDSIYGERPADQAGEARRRRAVAEQIYARQMQAPALTPPQAQGAPMALNTGSSGAADASKIHGARGVWWPVADRAEHEGRKPGQSRYPAVRWWRGRRSLGAMP